MQIFNITIKLVILISILCLCLLPQNIQAQTDIITDQIPINSYYATAKVTNVENQLIEEKVDDITHVSSEQYITLKILNSKLKDQEFTIINEITSNPVDLELQKNDKIIVNIEEFTEQSNKIYIVGYYRLTGVISMVFLFFLLLIILAGKQGLKTIISLLISIILIFQILIPQILNGHNAIILTLIISLLVTILTLTLIAGINKKALIAILGTLTGLIIAIIISYVFAKLSYLNGLSTEEARTLFYKFPNINPHGIFLSGIIIAALGAVMDVAMSIASSLQEIKDARPDIGLRKLFKSGIKVGRDIIGTMSNTLIFAYVGVSLPLLLLYQEYGDSFKIFVNLDFITDEIVRSIGGSIGLIAVIPMTSLFAAFLYSKTKK